MSIKIKTSWADKNLIIDGVRIYKSSASFDMNSRPTVYAEILDGSDFYEDFNVAEGQTYFYMLSCFLGEQEVFTDCFEVEDTKHIEYLPISFSGTKFSVGGSGTSTTNALAFQEFANSTSNKLIVVIAVSFVSVNPPPGWVKTTTHNNVQVFWKKGGNPYQYHNFILSSASFIGLYAVQLDVTGIFDSVDVTARNVSASISSVGQEMTTPSIADIQKNGPSYEFSTMRLNQLSGGTINATWVGTTKILDGGEYQLSLCLAGRATAKDAQLVGNTVSTNYQLTPNTANLQTIQICAYKS